MRILEGKRVLFICPIFYTYHAILISHLAELGAEVDFFENKIFKEDKAVGKNWISLFRRFINPGVKSAYNESILNAIKSFQYDYLFCIDGFILTQSFIGRIKQLNPNIVSVLYFWDSFSVYDYSPCMGWFDRVYSFDPDDCGKYPQLEYFPLFYTEDANSRETMLTAKPEIDVLYIGSVGMISMNRLYDLENLIKSNVKGLRTFFWVYIKEMKRNSLGSMLDSGRFLFSAKYRAYVKALRYYKENYDFIHQETLSTAQVVDLMARSIAVLDIPVPGQQGLTMRTIETLALQKKLITTNVRVLKEAFYREDTIKVIDNSYEINKSFLSAKHEPIDLTYLELNNWLKHVLVPEEKNDV